MLDLREPSTTAEASELPQGAVGLASRHASGRISVRMSGANPAPRISGAERLPGASNYFIGSDPTKWRAGVPTFARVEYGGVYPGVDLVYYGNRRRLEYDFLVAPGADPRRIELEFGGAEDVRLGESGDLVLRVAGGGELRQLKPVSYQVIDGERREVESRYALVGDSSVGFELGEYDRTLPLVIDPVLSYSTYLGGIGVDVARAVARGSDGSIYVTGYTHSTDFQGTSGVPPSVTALPDAFVLKLNPAGTAVVYSTYVGGEQVDEGWGIAVGPAGDAYVVGYTLSANFPITAGALQTAKGGAADAFALRLNPTGTALSYSTFIGGPSFDYGLGVAVDDAGHAHVTGQSFSARFINGVPMQKGGSPVYKTTDSETTWRPAENGFDDSSATAFAIHPTDPNIVYAGSSAGVYKTTDRGATWRLTGSGHPVNDPLFVSALAIDPASPSTLYVASTDSGVRKTTDGGISYSIINNGFSYPGASALAVHPTAPGTVYAGTDEGLYRTTNGGASWVRSNFQTTDPNQSGLITRINRIAIDPTNPAVAYAATDYGIFKTTDGGANWIDRNRGLILPYAYTVVVDPMTPSVLYAGVESGGVFKSTDGGENWNASNAGLQLTNEAGPAVYSVTSLAINPAAPSILYAGAFGAGVFKSTDAGATWVPSSAGITNLTINTNALELDRANPASVYVGFNTGSDAFAVRLNASGTAADYSLFIGGDESDFARGIALGADGNAYLVGTTRSLNFPVVSPLQAASGGGPDAFVAKLSPSGATLYSTYLGGVYDDYGQAIAVDPSGRAHVTGRTHSPNFPVAGPRQTALNSDPDVFVARLGAAGTSLDYSVLHGGRRDEDGLAIALDPDGNAYVTGFTNSLDFPTANPAQAARGNFQEAFVLKIGPASEMRYSTYLGGASSERGLGITADAAGSAYVVGTTSSPDFPLISPLKATNSGSDAFLARLSDPAVPCTYNVSPTSLSTGGAAMISTVNVTAGDGCVWAAVSNADWITITAGASGRGNGSVNFAVAPNGGSAARSGTLTIAGQTVTVTQAAAAPAIQFAQTGYQVSESAGRATLFVTRAGDASGAVNVDYRTADSDTFTVGCADAAGAAGAAYARCDFATAVGTLSFAPGEMSKSITVPVIDDAHVEGPETFQLRLSNAAGASLGAFSTTTVTISDNDSAGASNPISSSSFGFFVRQQYLDFLSREPDDAGFNAWLNVLNTCQPSAFTGPEVRSGCDRIHVSGEGFFRSQEFALKGAYAFRFYKAAFDRLPEYAEITSDMSFVSGSTQAEVFQRRAELAARFMQRQEFTQLYGDRSDQQYVAALLGRYNLTQVTAPDPANPDTGGKVTLTAAQLAALPRDQSLRAIADSDEVNAAEFNNAFVAMQYYGYLRRTPEQGGYDAWLRVIRQDPQNIRQMVNGFMNSQEYRLRFGQP
ncbi:MAG TPA: SBBP repeat-containing protein [Pyrinomonadaceae bacterium]|nr:SBBP repeat-containing protein [Pyrinomonadaceae bacterium]